MDGPITGLAAASHGLGGRGPHADRWRSRTPTQPAYSWDGWLESFAQSMPSIPFLQWISRWGRRGRAAERRPSVRLPLRYRSRVHDSSISDQVGDWKRTCRSGVFRARAECSTCAPRRGPAGGSPPALSRVVETEGSFARSSLGHFGPEKRPAPARERTTPPGEPPQRMTQAARCRSSPASWRVSCGTGGDNRYPQRRAPSVLGQRRSNHEQRRRHSLRAP